MNNETCGCGTEEKTNTAKGIVRINYKEDFELVVELLAGDKPYKLGDEDFRIDFIVMASRYTVGRTAGVCERCSVDGNKIRCFMDGHGLPPGELRAEVKVNTPDPNYADGSRLSVAIAEGTVVLVKDNTRFDGAVVKANIPVALVDAYQLAKAHGYKGTIDEYYATFTKIGQLKENIKGTLDEMTEAERLRADAEKERAKAETERQNNRDKFNTAESERVKNEQQRQDSEGKRQQAELNRFTAEDYRVSAEVERLNAEKQRNDAEQARKTAEKERVSAEVKRADTDKERDELVSKMQAAWQEIERMKNLREGEYGKEIELVEKIKNAAKIPTQNVWLDATDGEIKSTPASEGINANAYKYYYIGRREVVGKMQNVGANKYVTHLDLSNWNVEDCTDASWMLAQSPNLQTVAIGRMPNVINIYRMLFKCPSLQEFDANGWNCHGLTEIKWIFDGDTSLRRVDFRSCSFHNVPDANGIFSGCTGLVELWLPMTFDLLSNLNLWYTTVWGATPEGLASLRWTFGEGADDRTAKGLQPCTVRLHANVYDRLTDNERAAAAKKGWTITK